MAWKADLSKKLPEVQGWMVMAEDIAMPTGVGSEVWSSWLPEQRFSADMTGSTSVGIFFDPDAIGGTVTVDLYGMHTTDRDPIELVSGLATLTSTDEAYTTINIGANPCPYYKLRLTSTASEEGNTITVRLVY
jgi:hypothetical protein|tara:strand:+ start:13423 stop:13821 length:399 start_codon:yes stop_codon:yes gene_type:complete